MSQPFAILCAGGTGGHVFPAEALASELLARGWRLGLMTDQRGNRYGGTLGQLENYPVTAGGIAGRGILSKIKGAFELGLGVMQARKMLKELKPDVVVGFGGYASLPGVLAASQLGIKTLIHEQNGVLGRANRLLASRVDGIATCMPLVQFVDPTWGDKVTLTGNPARPAIATFRDDDQPQLDENGPIHILVTGGSQGARVFSEILPQALIHLPKALQARIHLSQQCRPEDLEAVEKTYQGSALNVTLRTFFDDIPDRLAKAHLVICRSGASTVAELTVMGRAAILVPYPFAIDDHQTANAKALVASGGAILMAQPDFTVEKLVPMLQDLLSNPVLLAELAAKAKAAGRPNAAQLLADSVARLAVVAKEHS